MNNRDSNKSEESNLGPPQESHRSTESEEETAQPSKGTLLRNHPPFTWKKGMSIFPSLGVVLWFPYPNLLTGIKDLLPDRHSTLALLLTVGIPAFMIIVLILWRVPKWQVASVGNLSPDKRFELENEARKTLAEIIGGVLILSGLFFTAENLRVTQENADNTQRLADSGQVTDRFTKAITQLGTEKIEVRLGGIYALDKIARDHPDDYHWTVMEILASFVREKAPQESTSPSKDQVRSKESLTRIKRSSQEEAANEKTGKIAIQAILTVIGGRQLEWGKEGEKQRERRNQTLDLRNTNLDEMKLEDASLDRANLSGASLSGAHLSRAHLSGANLSDAILTGQAELVEADLKKNADVGEETNLSGAHLNGANLNGANLSGANLRRAHLNGAFLIGTDLSGANLSDADLSGTDVSKCNPMITWEQIESAVIDKRTGVPVWFKGQKEEKLKQQSEQQQKSGKNQN